MQLFKLSCQVGICIFATSIMFSKWQNLKMYVWKVMFEGLREVRLQSQKTLLLFFYAHIKCILLTSHCTSDKEKNIEHIENVCKCQSRMSSLSRHLKTFYFYDFLQDYAQTCFLWNWFNLMIMYIHLKANVLIWYGSTEEFYT